MKNKIVITLCGLLFSTQWIFTNAVTLEILIIVEPGNKDLSETAVLAIEKLGSSFTIKHDTITTDNKSLVQKVCEANKTKIDAIIDLTSDGFGVVDLAKHLDAPVMTMKWSADAGTPTIRPNPRDYMRSLTSLMLQDNKTREAVMILYEKNFGTVCC